MKRIWTQHRWIANLSGEVWLDPSYPDEPPAGAPVGNNPDGPDRQDSDGETTRPGHSDEPVSRPDLNQITDRSYKLDRLKIEAEFDRLVAEHGLQGVRLVWNERLRTTLGRYLQHLQIVELATFLTTDEASDTLLHEIAHALTPPDAPPHGVEWRAACETLGIRPERNGHAEGWESVQEPIRWYAACPFCEDSVGYRRKPRTPKRCEPFGLFPAPLPLHSADGERWAVWQFYQVTEEGMPQGEYVDVPNDHNLARSILGGWSNVFPVEGIEQWLKSVRSG